MSHNEVNNENPEDMENLSSKEPQDTSEVHNNVEPNTEENIEPSNLEDAVVQLSAEELDKYDNFEQYVQDLQQGSKEPVKNANLSNEESTEQKVNQNNTEESTSEDTNVMSDEEFRQFITGEFRANNRNVQVKDPNDIRKLMQYGMNYHKKMAELAPHRKILKALEHHGLTDESKVNFAIELMQGNPSAIAQLLKQHEIDSYNLPDLEENPYNAGNYIPSDTKVNFDEVMDDIKQSQHGSQVINLIQNLDNDSFRQIYTNPVMVQNLAKHAESGLMQDALATLETEKALGKVPAGISDIDAYAYVAQHLEKNNPSKYGITNSAPKVVGNNLNKSNTRQTKSVNNPAKTRASIPSGNNVSQEQSYSGIEKLLNASNEDLNKYDNWEQYLAANNLNF